MDLDLLNSAYHHDAMDYHGVFDGTASDFAQTFHQARASKDDYSCAGQPSTP